MSELQPITVRQLIEKLQALPEEKKNDTVEMEGCDCWTTAAGLKLAGNTLVIVHTDTTVRGELL